MPMPSILRGAQIGLPLPISESTLPPLRFIKTCDCHLIPAQGAHVLKPSGEPSAPCDSQCLPAVVDANITKNDTTFTRQFSSSTCLLVQNVKQKTPVIWNHLSSAERYSMALWSVTDPKARGCVGNEHAVHRNDQSCHSTCVR